MDFYWYYSRKDIIDPGFAWFLFLNYNLTERSVQKTKFLFVSAGKANFFKAIGVASQVFNTLTEVIQGPCVGNQQTLAHSR